MIGPESPPPKTPPKTNIPGWLIALVLFGIAFAVTGCGAVVGAGAGVGVAAMQERGLEGKARDLKLEVLVAESWLRTDHTYSVRMSIEVYEGRVLLTGVVDDEKVGADAVRLAWTVEGVMEVLNEIQVRGGDDVADYARDAWITASLKSTLTFDEDVLAINYSIETVNGVIYLIGIAQHQVEMDRVLGHARSIKYVRKVVNHVRVKAEQA